MEIIVLIISLIGAAAWLPWLFERFSSSKIYAKIISLTMSPGLAFKYEGKLGQEQSSGLGYVLKLAVTVIDKTLNLKRIKVTIKYPGEEKIYVGKVIWARSFELTLGGKPYKLQIPSWQFLPFASVLEKDKLITCYLSFIVDKADFENFEFIRLEFVDFREKSISVTIHSNEVDYSLLLFEDSLWTPIENHH